MSSHFQCYLVRLASSHVDIFYSAEDITLPDGATLNDVAELGSRLHRAEESRTRFGLQQTAILGAFWVLAFSAFEGAVEMAKTSESLCVCAFGIASSNMLLFLCLQLEVKFPIGSTLPTLLKPDVKRRSVHTGLSCIEIFMKQLLYFRALFLLMQLQLICFRI